MSNAAKGRAREQKGATAWLRLGDRRYRDLIENLSDVIALIDAEGRIAYASPSSKRLLGYEQAELEGRSVFELVPPPEVESLRARFEQAVEVEGEVRPMEFQFRHQDGVWRLLEGVGRRFPGEPPLLLLTVRDITDSRRAEHAQLETEVRYQTLFERNPFPMWAYDVDSLQFLAVNDAAVEHYGYSREEFLGMTLRDIRPAAELPKLESDVGAVRSGTLDPQSWNAAVWKHRKKDGTVFDVEIRSTTLSFGGWQARLVMAKDVSTERRLEDQLRQAQKMEAVGRLSAGVAHDFNNLLGIILGYGAILRARLTDESLRVKLEQIMKAGEQAAGLTRQLLTFSRKQVVQPRVIDLGALVTDMCKMLQRVVGEDIDLKIVAPAGLRRVRADPGQVEQVLMNLVTNARDAMPNGGGLTIETADVELGSLYASEHAEVSAGRYVLLAVSDTGTGMDAETQRHIFEPFFTTKDPGKGTGLGLATAYGIATQSGGHIALYSEVGRGTTFKVYLPAVDAPTEGRVARGEQAFPGGTETVLVVEDDAGLRELTREVLDEHGYRVLSAASGPEALALAEAHQGPIQLLLTDVVMLGMSGRELAQALAIPRPQTKVLFTSGYTDDAILHHRVLEEGTAFIQKPFTPGSLLAKVREALGERPA